MKRWITVFLLLTFLLGACASGNPVTEVPATEKTAPSETATNVPATAEPTETEPAAAGREALLSEVENEVTARTSSSGELSPASDGMTILETGEVETKANSRVRMDLVPDGTIVRVGPNSSFTVPTLATEEGAPKTKLTLFFGQIFIILNGGSLDVETPSGLASVRGSLMSVTYSENQSHMTVTCLEGHCHVESENEEGETEEVDLTEGQAADVSDGVLEEEIREMTFEELGVWMLDNPDLEEHIEELPPLPDMPEDFNWDYDFDSDPDFEFFFDPEYDPGEIFFDPEFNPEFDPAIDPDAPTLEPEFDSADPILDPDLNPVDPEPVDPEPESDPVDPEPEPDDSEPEPDPVDPEPEPDPVE